MGVCCRVARVLSQFSFAILEPWTIFFRPKIVTVHLDQRMPDLNDLT